jgi:DNA-binding IscR family transcriptional regulator
MLRTNAVVVRRTMAGLRDSGYVTSEKGHGGGWTLARPLDRISIADIYQALGEPRLFLIGPADEAPDCLVEQAVNGALASAFDDARKLLMARMEKVTLAAIASSFQARLASGPGTVHPGELSPDDGSFPA